MTVRQQWREQEMADTRTLDGLEHENAELRGALQSLAEVHVENGRLRQRIAELEALQPYVLPQLNLEAVPDA